MPYANRAKKLEHDRERMRRIRESHREEYNLYMNILMKRKYHFQKEWKRLAAIQFS